MGEHIVVAIDGPAGAGKSTVARSVAARLGFLYVDTGAMYRAVALWAQCRNIDTSDMHRLEQLAREADIRFESGTQRVLLNGEDVTGAIRTPEISAASSQVAAVPAVRRALVDKQRRMAEQANIVMEGRDIGSNVFPEAKVKIYLDAPADVRAVRRARELAGRGVPADAAVTGREIEERDHRDRSRPEAPLLQAPDAVYVDTAGLNEEEVAEAVLKIVRDRTTNGKEYAR
jgi:cytidylate kinase